MHRREFVLAVTATGLLNAEERPEELNGGMRLYWGEKWDKPFLYPIKTLSGAVLSRGWPLEPRQGDSTDHTWHRGFWYGHGDINGADYWREQGREKTSRLVAKSPPKGGKIELTMMPPSGKAMGSIVQDFRIRDTSDVRMIDAVITIRADAGQALTFGDTDDGGFAFRLDESFREDRGARLRNAEGLTGTSAIWGKPARWVDYSAVTAGVNTGVAIFDHPSNLRHPTRWHARGYGLNAANPFALKSFTKDPSADGRYALPAGQTLRLQYRAIIYEGAPDIDALYQNYAKS